MNYQVTANHPIAKYLDETIQDIYLGKYISRIIDMGYEISSVKPKEETKQECLCDKYILENFGCKCGAST